MARPRAKLDTHGQSEELLDRLRGEPAGIARERMLAVKHGMEGELTLDQIARLIGRSQKTIQYWFELYRRGGLEELCTGRPGRRGRKPALDARGLKELRKKLARGSFRTAGQAAAWLESRFKVKRSLSSIRRWMGKLGAGLKVVRPRHPGSDEGRRESFKSQLARRIHEAVVARNPPLKKRPLRVWVADEGRFGLKPCHRRAWVSRGVRAHRDSSRRYEWNHVWAALQVGGGGSEFLYSNVADKEVAGHFLEQISRRDPHAVHVVIWDGAGFHPLADDPLVPENVVVLRQPPYSPELNPVEKLWDLLRDELCNRRWADLEQMMTAVSRWLKDFWESPRRILSLVGEGWLRVQANA